LSITPPDSDKLSDDLDRLASLHTRLQHEKRQISNRLATSEPDENMRISLLTTRELIEIMMSDVQKERFALSKKLIKIQRHERALERSRFTRPSNRFIDPFNRMLGPLPEGLNAYQPTEKNLRKVRSYRLFGGVLIVIAITLLISLSASVPWLAISPATLITSALGTFMDPTAAGILAFPICIALLIFLSRGISHPRYEGKEIDGAAMHEEQWFRSGAEAWTAKQRLFSCIAFGSVHVMNIFYPLASLIVVGLVGGVFLWVYLREYKRTGSTRRATFASTKLHATYNRFAFLYMFAAIGMGFILPLLP
jgi:hypothetical protein